MKKKEILKSDSLTPVKYLRTDAGIYQLIRTTNSSSWNCFFIVQIANWEFYIYQIITWLIFKAKINIMQICYIMMNLKFFFLYLFEIK